MKSTGTILATTIAEVRDWRRELHLRAKTLGLVPTMGALHAGHRSLIRAAFESCDAVAVSIFVNPAQFGPEEDFARYPRTPEEDRRMLEQAGVDLLFTPPVEEIYPGGAEAFVEVPALSGRLDGVSRPGHFRGVATVVAKLLNIFEPDRIFFGQKDAVQAAVLKRMMRDLDFNCRFQLCPTVRDAEGLALSSRNRYLGPGERQQALTLPRALSAVRRRVEEGEVLSPLLIAEARRVFAETPGVKLEYVAIVDPESLEPLANVRKGALVAVAGCVGSTRLIDNLLLPAI